MGLSKNTFDSIVVLRAHPQETLNKFLRILSLEGARMRIVWGLLGLIALRMFIMWARGY